MGKIERLIDILFKSKSTLNDRSKIYLKYYKKRIIKNSVLVESNRGVGLQNSPLAFLSNCISDDCYKEYKFIVSLTSTDDIAEYKKIFNKFPMISFVQRNSEEYLKCLATSEYLVTNRSFGFFFIKREGQIYINLIDGMPSKKIGYDSIDDLYAYRNVIRNVYQSDYILFPDHMTYETYKKSLKLDESFTGELIETNIYELKDSYKNILEQTYENLDLYDDSNELILYIPAHENWKDSIANYEADSIRNNMEYLNENLGEKYKILCKTNRKISKHLKNKKAIDLIPDGVDIEYLITKSKYIITNDINIYNKAIKYNIKTIFLTSESFDFNEIYLSIDEEKKMNISSSLNEIVDKIKTDQYLNLKDNNDENSYNFSQTIHQILNKEIKKSYVPKKTRLLFYGGPLYNGGLTHALFSHLNAIDYKRYDVTVLFPTVIEELRLINNINPNVRVIFQCGHPLLNKIDSYKFNYYKNFGKVGKIGDILYPKKILNNEAKRCFGNLKFDYIVDYSGHELEYQGLLFQVECKKRLTWQHTDYKRTFTTKKFNGENNMAYKPELLKGIIKNYENYDLIVACSESTMEINKSKLGNRKIIDKFDYCNNLVNINRIDNGINQKAEFNESSLIFKNSNKNNIITEQIIPYYSENYNIVSVGRLSPEKNYMNLVAAFKKIADKYGKCSLYIIGDGPQKDVIYKLIDKFKLNSRVFLMGNMDNPISLMQYMDCFILPSLYEGYPISVLEARSIKLNVVIADFDTSKSVMIPNGQIITGKKYNNLFLNLEKVMQNKKMDYEFSPLKHNEESMMRFESFLE